MGGNPGSGCCVGNCCVANNPEISCCVADSPEIRRAAQIEEELNNAITAADEKGAVLEQELINCINGSTEEIKAFLNQFTVERYARHALKFDFENLDTLTKKFVSELGNFISEKIKRRLVREDKEVVVILAEPDDNNRKKNLDAFCERLFRNALKDLISKTETFFQSLAESTTKDISTLQEKLDDTKKPYARLDDAREQIKNFIVEKKNYARNILETRIADSKKNFPAKSIRLRDIAKEFDFAISGDDAELEIFSMKYAHEADENSLAIAYSEKDILKTAAQAVLTEPKVVPVQKNFLYSGFKELHLAIMQIARLFIAEGIYPDYEKIFPQSQSNGSMFGANVAIGEGTFIAPFVNVGENVKIGKNCRIESGVFIGSGTQIGDGVKILSGSRVGVNCHYHYGERGRHKSFCGVGRAIIGNGVEIGSNTVIQRGSFSDTVIGAGTLIGNLVEIAHDVKIGEGCLIVSQVGICGNVTIGNRVQIFGQAGIKNWVTVGDDAIILAKSGVTKNIRAGQKVSGMFSREHADELKRLAKSKIVKEE